MLYSSRSLFYLDWKVRGWNFCVRQINRVARPLNAEVWSDRNVSQHSYLLETRQKYEKLRDGVNLTMTDRLHGRTISQLLYDKHPQDIEAQYNIKERYQNRFFWKHYQYVQMNRKGQKRCSVVKLYSEFIWKTLLRL
jgi:hypothetical protein